MKKKPDSEDTKMAPPLPALPTTFELCQLATMVNRIDDRPVIALEDKMNLAMDFWFAACKTRENYTEAHQQLHELFLEKSVFTMSELEWSNRIKDFKGHQRNTLLGIYSNQYPTEKLKRQLFKDTSLTNRQRDKLFLSLADFGIKFDVPFPAPRVVESLDEYHKKLSRPSISGLLARWLVVCRERQLANNRKRIIPTSLRRRN